MKNKDVMAKLPQPEPDTKLSIDNGKQIDFENNVRICKIPDPDIDGELVMVAEVKLYECGGKGLNKHSMNNAIKLLTNAGYKPTIGSFIQFEQIGRSNYLNTYKIVRFSHIIKL